MLVQPVRRLYILDVADADQEELVHLRDAHTYPESIADPIFGKPCLW